MIHCCSTKDMCLLWVVIRKCAQKTHTLLYVYNFYHLIYDFLLISYLLKVCPYHGWEYSSTDGRLTKALHLKGKK